MGFKVGQQVVCVDDSCHMRGGTIKSGNIYTILDINGKGGLILNTEENGSRFSPLGWWGYGPNRFRPLDYGIISNKGVIKDAIEERLDVEIKEPVLD